MPDELLDRLRRFHDDSFPTQRSLFRHLVDDGQHPTTLFIGCSDSRLVPYLLTGAGPGELFLVRNVGAFVPPWDQSEGFHGTAAAIEFAVLNLNVERIVVCGHSHCGAIRALYGEVPSAAQNLRCWLELGREAALPVADPGPEALRRTEQRAVVLQLERLTRRRTSSATRTTLRARSTPAACPARAEPARVMPQRRLPGSPRRRTTST
ncbi:MAG: carbonic anhydrase [Burkholderiaceae bacterium]|nr:carbonic anhydrase [Burkholderiaceae bacterium]